MEEKYYIWGAGLEGAKAHYHLNKWIDIEGFIDGNPEKVGKTYLQKPIIDFDEYLRRKNNGEQVKIIIAILLDYKKIREFLEEHGVHDYYDFIDCPPEFHSTYYNEFFEEYVMKLIDKNTQYQIYGSSIYSVVVNEWVKKITGEYAELTDQPACKKDGTRLLVTVRAKYDETDDNIINVFDCSDEIEVFHNKKLEKFRDCNVGKRCFIVATGPSLNKKDLDILHQNGELSISMNAITEIFHDTKWRPDYYLTTDWRTQEIVDFETLDVENIIVGDFSQDFMKSKHSENIYISHVIQEVDEDCEPKFSTDFSKCCRACGTITYICMQFAVYMGIKEIYLLGVDFSGYGKPGETYAHFYKDKAKAAICFSNQCINAYRSAKRYADEHGIKIYNATRGGKLEVFERVDFDSLF